MTDRQTPQNPEQGPSTDGQHVAPPAGGPEIPPRPPLPPQQAQPPHPAPSPGPQPPVPPQPYGLPAPQGPWPQPPVAPAGQPEPVVAPAGQPAADDAAVTPPEFPEARDPIAAPDALDEGTYTEIREPRSQGLELDGRWHQISPKYVVSQLVQELFWLAVVVVGALVLHLALDQPWAWAVAGVIMVFQVVSLIILPRQAKALGYMLRGDDIVFRKGILWQRVIAVPYGRMQLIDITHGPLDRMFGVAKLKMVTAAASTGVEIPGLSQQAAEALRDALIQVAETRRTGL